MKRLQAWAVLAALVVPGTNSRAGDAGDLPHASSVGMRASAGTQGAANAVAASVELVEFTAQWCDQCREMDPLMEEVRARGYRVTRVDVDEQVEVARHYGITQVPTILIVSRGKVVDRIKGATTAETLWPHVRAVEAGRPMAAASPSARTTPSRPVPAHAGPSHSGPAHLGPSHSGPSPGPATVASAGAVASAGGVGARPDQARDQVSDHATDQASLERRALEATVRLRVEDPNGQSFGSGTIVDVHGSEALVLTCGHIFRDSRGKGKIHVELCGLQPAVAVNGELIGFDEQRDVALVAIQTPVTVRPVRVAGPAHPVAKGQALFSMGCNRGAEPTVMRGSLRSINQYLGPENLVVEGEPIDGRSGGGLFSYDGYLVGVCNAADPERREGIYAAYPSICKYLDQAKLAFVYRGEEAPALANASPIPPQLDRSRENRPRLDATSAEEASANTDRAARPGTLPGIPGASRPQAPARSLAPPDMTMASTAAPANSAAFPRDAATLAASDAGRALEANIARLQSQGAEVICIIRPRMDPNAKSEVVVLDRPSRGFLDQLMQERTDQGNRQMTGLRVPLERRLHPERVAPARANAGGI